MIKAFNGQVFTSIGDELFATKHLEQHEKHSREFDVIQKKTNDKKPKRISIPPMNHPWKRDSFIRYLKSKGITQEFNKKQTHKNIG